MKIFSKSVLMVLCAFVIMGNQCSNQQAANQSASQTDKAPDPEQIALKADMDVIANKITQLASREETLKDVSAVADKYPSQALLVFVSDKYRALDPVPARRIVSQLAETGFNKFGTAQWQFYHANLVGTGVDMPPDPVKALAILDMPATGTMRNSLTLRAKMLIKLGDAAGTPKGAIEELLQKAAKLGDGEAAELLAKIGTGN